MRNRICWLSMLCGLTTHAQPAPEGAEGFLDRWRQMALFSRVEDSFATDRGFWPRSVLASGVPITEGGTRAASLPRQRGEWATRLGAASGSLSFADMASLKDASLVDGALWTLLQAKAPDPFAPDVDWTIESRPFRNYLRTTRVAGLDKQAHGAWWIWFREGRLVKNADPLLKAVHFYVQGRVLRGTLRLEAWMEARAKLASTGDPTESLDRRIFIGLLAEGRSPLMLVEALSGVRRKDLESVRPALLRSFARMLRREEFPGLSPRVARLASVRAEAQSLLLRLKAGDQPSPSELLNLALLEYEIGEHAFAERFAKAALEAGSSEAGGREDLGFLSKALGVLAQASQRRAEEARDPVLRRRRLEWAAEHTRRALGVMGRSRSREPLLQQYAEALAELGAREEADRVFDDLFQESVDRPAMIAALTRQTRLLDGHLRAASAGERDALFRRFLAKANLLHQWTSTGSDKKWTLARAQFWANNLGLAKDKSVRATLREMGGAP